MTLPSPDAKPYGWAGNCGGGDFLMWIDDASRYRAFGPPGATTTPMARA